MTMKLQRRWTAFALLAIAACGGGDGGAGGAEGALAGSIEIDGSSTVYPITEAVAEEFGAGQPDVRVTVAQSGTGGGFKRFCAGEIPIANASRPIKDEEIQLCSGSSVDYIELKIGTDGLAVVVNPQNTAVQCLTVEELKKIWAPGSTVKSWSDVREGLPAEPLKLYGPGTNSGTFDYFTEAIVGESGSSRADYTPSEDDNVLVQGVEGDRNALGYFGYAYYIENQQRLRALGVDNGSGCVTPTPETVKGGTYAPLSRPLFIYVNRAALERPEVDAFVRFYLEQAAALVTEVGYIPLEPAEYEAGLTQLGQGGAQ